MMIVARIDYALTRGINWLTMCLVERARGYNSGEAGDHLQHVHADMLADAEAEEEVAEPYWGEPSRCPNAGRMCNCTGACLRPQSPAASAGRGESSSRAVSDVPPSPARERGCSCVEAPHNYCARHGAALGAHPMPTDPSPTIASRQHQPSVDGEGSPLDSAIPPAPRGERPTPGEFAVAAVLNGLADHQFRADPGSDPDFDQAGCCTCSVAKPMDEYDWREHVAAEIQRRIDAVITSQGPQ